MLNHYGYLAVAALVLVEDFGIPVPGETILIAASLYAGAGRLNVVLVGVIATLAAIAGDNIGFAIGHFGGRALALRYGKYIFLTAERLDKAEYFFDRHGGKIIVAARFIEGLRQANGIVAGITGMHWKSSSCSTRSAPPCGSASGSPSVMWPETTSSPSTTRSRVTRCTC